MPGSKEHGFDICVGEHLFIHTSWTWRKPRAKWTCKTPWYTHMLHVVLIYYQWLYIYILLYITHISSIDYILSIESLQLSMIFPLQRGDAMVKPCWASARGTAVWEAAVGAQHIFRGADVRQFELLIWEDFLMEGERHARIKQCRQPSIYIYIINKMMASIPAIAMVELRMVEPF